VAAGVTVEEGEAEEGDGVAGTAVAGVDVAGVAVEVEDGVVVGAGWPDTSVAGRNACWPSGASTTPDAEAPEGKPSSCDHSSESTYTA